jgi:hypothetical protein
MSAPYFYEPLITIGATNYTCSEETSKHCAQVLRMQSGEIGPRYFYIKKRCAFRMAF